MKLALAALACTALGGCFQRSGFVCETSTQCVFSGDQGMCTPAGFCAFTDGSCASGYRYGSDAGEFAGVCTGEEPDDPDGGSSLVDASPPVEYTPSNFSQDLLSSGTAELVLGGSDCPAEIDTTFGTILRVSDATDLKPNGVVFTTVTQASAPDIGVFSMRGLTIEAGCSVQVTGSAALGLAVTLDARVAGTLQAIGGRTAITDAGPGGFAGGVAAAPQGQGAGGGGSQAADGDVGGGGGGYLAAGGDGGVRGALPAGAGGSIYGVAELVPLVGGSGGGAAGGSTATRGKGGGGGGAIQISAGAAVVVDGVITSGGGGGGGGTDDDGGGGGGSGGAILLEGDRVEVTGVLACNGGGGGAGANNNSDGMAGQVGPPSASRALGGVGAGEGSSGGMGAGATVPGGSAGEATSGASNDDNAGGGGGAGGRVRLRANSIVRTGAVSPAASLSEATSL